VGGLRLLPPDISIWDTRAPSGWHGSVPAPHSKLIFRNEGLDYQRCKPEFVKAMVEDLRWLGLDRDEGLDQCEPRQLRAVFAKRTPQPLSRREQSQFSMGG
jgi:hypothetical protein